MAIDVNNILREYLIASGTDLFTLVGTRVWAGRYPDVGLWANETPGIVFWRRGGVNDPNAPIYRPSWQVFCYGGQTAGGEYDMRLAQLTYGAFEERMRDAAMSSETNGVLMGAIEESSAQDGVDEDTEWPVVISFWAGELREAA